MFEIQFWIGFISGTLVTIGTISVVAIVYVQTRGPLIVGPSQPPGRKK